MFFIVFNEIHQIENLYYCQWSKFSELILICLSVFCTHKFKNHFQLMIIFVPTILHNNWNFLWVQK